MELSEQKIRKELKRAKLFEVQKIVKRTRLLKKNKGTDAQLKKNQRKVTRLLAELDAIKDLNLGELASEVYQTVVEGGSPISCMCTGAEVAFNLEPTNKAKHRLLSNKTFLTSTSLGLHEHNESSKEHSKPPRYLEPSQGYDVGLHRKQDSDTDDSVHSKESDGDTELNSNETITSSTSLESLSDSEADSNTCGETTAQNPALSVTKTSLKGKMKKKRIQSVSSGNARGVGKGTELFSTKCTQRKKRKDKNSNVADDSSLEAVTGSGAHGLKLESVFVGTLSAEPSPVGTAQKRRHVKQKNRPGQRARQKQWEKEFGSKAKHLQKRNMKQKKDKGREVARKKGDPRQKNLLASPVAAPVLQGRQPASSSGQQLHPSWEAKRRKKTMEGGIGQFQGKKIVFSDSD